MKWQVDENVSWWNCKLMKLWVEFNKWMKRRGDEMASLTKRLVDENANWWNCDLMKWQVDKNSKLMKWQVDKNSKLMKWQVDEISTWSSNVASWGNETWWNRKLRKLLKRQVYKMASWWNEKVIK